jgi:GT2 family glycosyltransferase
MSGCVHIVIVDYRTADLVLDCLRTLSMQVADLVAGWVSVIPLDRNGGFAYGNNVGIRVAPSSACKCHSVFLFPMLYTPQQSHSGRLDD